MLSKIMQRDLKKSRQVVTEVCKEGKGPGPVHTAASPHHPRLQRAEPVGADPRGAAPAGRRPPLRGASLLKAGGAGPALCSAVPNLRGGRGRDAQG